MATQHTSRLHCSAWCLSEIGQALSSCQCIHQSRTHSKMMMPAVPALRLIPVYAHGVKWGRDETDAVGDLWQLVAHWPQNKKALGLKKWVYGTAVWDWMPGPTWDLPCFQSNQIVCNLPTTGFSTEIPWAYRVIVAERRQGHILSAGETGHKLFTDKAGTDTN